MRMLRQRASNTPTPRQLKKRRSSRYDEDSEGKLGDSSRKVLFGNGTKTKSNSNSTEWTSVEEAALVQFIALYHAVDEDRNNWPATKDEHFWMKCADAVACTTNMKKGSGRHAELDAQKI
ncbi:uncharacterized protein [Ptychodera flava]|uniref:uncharacterized protein isoform X2 n=1 Tax=Ptychodera flava TaxID=63121 RepID=UPI00396A8D20